MINDFSIIQIYDEKNLGQSKFYKKFQDSCHNAIITPAYGISVVFEMSKSYTNITSKGFSLFICQFECAIYPNLISCTRTDLRTEYCSLSSQNANSLKKKNKKTQIFIHKLNGYGILVTSDSKDLSLTA